MLGHLSASLGRLGAVDGDCHSAGCGNCSRTNRVFFFQNSCEGSPMHNICYGKCTEGWKKDRQNTVDVYRGGLPKLRGGKLALQLATPNFDDVQREWSWLQKNFIFLISH